MEKAKQSVQENLNLEEDDSKKHENIKVEINNLCFMYLPKETTLEQTEAIAFTIYDMLTNPQTYLKK